MEMYGDDQLDGLLRANALCASGTCACSEIFRTLVRTPPPRVDFLNNITVNDTFTFDLSALGERVQVGRRHPAGVFKSDVKRLQRMVSRLFFQHII